MAGCSHEGRQSAVRLLAPGDAIFVKPLRHQKDENALAVYAGQKHVGWVPANYSKTVRGLDMIGAKVTSVGTDARGAWTELLVEIEFLRNEKSRELEEKGIEAAVAGSVAGVVSPDVAESLRGLSPEEQRAALDELSMLRASGLAPKRRRRKRCSSRKQGT